MDDDANEPILPPMPASSTYHPRPSRPSLLTRKRTHSSYATDLDGGAAANNPQSAASSDPAFFSGDEAAPGAENYEVGKRKKKMYTGSWWSHQIKAGKLERKKAISRNFDSGVWMGSDEASSGFSSDSLGSMEEAFLRDQGFQHETRLSAADDLAVQHPDRDDRRPDVGPSTRRTGKRVSVFRSDQSIGHSTNLQLHEQVRDIIRHTLDSGNEAVSLYGMGLSDLPTEIAELATLTTQPLLVEGMLNQGRRFTTDLSLVLSNNLFTRLPTPVLHLENLSMLSLRSNGLTSIPPGIRRLTNLRELNISNNQLTHLPFEIIELLRFHKLSKLFTGANPWTQSPSALPPLPTSTTRNPSSLIRRTMPPPFPTPTNLLSTTPSLTELTLRRLTLIAPTSELTSLMPLDTPASVLRALDDFTAAQRDGGRQCTRCHRSIVQPQREWLEWWYVGVADADLPFGRGVCAVGCTGGVDAWVDEGAEDVGRDVVAGMEQVVGEEWEE